MTSAIRSILVPLAPPGDEPTLLAWAGRLAGDFDARVDAAYVREDWKASPGGLGLGADFGFYMTDALIEQLDVAARQAESEARDAFEAAVTSAPAGRFGRFLRVAERFDVGLGRAARCCDLALAALPGDPYVQSREDVLETLLIGGGVPVLAVPAGLGADAPLERALVAWNDSVQSARALRAATPFLERADVVHVARFGVHEEEEDDVSAAAEYLAAHGIQVEAHQPGAGGPPPAEAIIGHAATIAADLIVMGGYGRARWVEQAVGGVTRHILRHATQPVLLAH